MKRFILITGMFTAGKTTLANNIIKDNSDIMVIPQATTRQRRNDDNPIFFRYYDKNIYNSLKFFSCFGNYGILMDDIKKFILSDKKAAIAIVSTPDINVFLNKIPRKYLYLILRTLTPSLEEEKKEINKRFPYFFSGITLQNRIDLAVKLSEDFYFNSEYNSNFDQIFTLKDNGSINVDGIIISARNDGDLFKRGNEQWEER